MKILIKYILSIIIFSIVTTLINVVLRGDITSVNSFVFGCIFWMIISLIGWTLVFGILYLKLNHSNHTKRRH